MITKKRLRVATLCAAIFTMGSITLMSQLSQAMDLFHVELSDFNANNIGYSGQLVNGPGALISAPVTYVRFDRKVIKLSSNRYAIQVSYPAAMMSSSFHLEEYLPQTGMAFECGIRQSGLRAGIRLVHVDDQADRFWDFRSGPPSVNRKENEPDYIRALKGYSDGARICRVIVDIDGHINQTDAQGLGRFITTGLPDLSVRQDIEGRKNYADIAQPYIQFLNGGDVTFRTDDEFWFLVAASVHHEPILTAQFTKTNVDFVKDWVAQLVLYVVHETGNKKWTRYVQSMLPPNIKFKKTYSYIQVLNERVYEL